MHYKQIALIKDSGAERVERVLRMEDETVWIRRTYREDKREVFFALQSLQSSSIPKIERIEFTDCTIVIEEEISGVLLSQRLLSQKLSRAEAYALAEQLLSVLEQLHSQSIIHRDVKPDNIIITESGQLVLIDYGIARIYRPGAARDTSLFGTEGYAAPEQYGFAQSDIRTDIYAAGIVIQELATAAGCKPRDPLYKIASQCAQFSPASRYKDVGDALRQLKKAKAKPFYFIALIGVTGLLAAIVFYVGASLSLSQREPPSASTEIPVISAVSKIEEVWHPEWVPIMETPAQEERVTLYDGEQAQIVFTLAPDADSMHLQGALQDGALLLTLSGPEGEEQKFTFVNNHPPQILDFEEGTAVDGEILFYDLNLDGQNEILVALSDRQLLEGMTGQTLCNTNWRILWCLGYTPGEGFWQAEGAVYPDFPWDRIQVGFMDSGEIFLTDSWLMYQLEGRELVAYQG